MTPLEKDIEKHLTRAVGRAGGLCLKWVCPGFSGVPDRLVLIPGGRVVFYNGPLVKTTLEEIIVNTF